MELTIKEESTRPRADHQEICAALVAELSGQIPEPGNTGLYLASPDAGMQPSVSFWALAQAQGPGFMSPQNFPWTLANGPAAHLAIALGLKGPNFTFLGDDTATEAALEQAEWDIEAGLVAYAVVLTVSFGGAGAWKIQVLNAVNS